MTATTVLRHHYLPLLCQTMVTLIVAIGLILVQKTWLSAWLCGCAITIMGNFWYTFRAAVTRKVRSSQAFLATVNRGLIEKYLLAASGFAVTFVIIKPQTPVLVLVSALIMMLIHFSASVWLHTRVNSNNLD